jgi:hypothetical protein
VAKVAAAAAVGLIVISLLPGLLRAPEPPPLGADVGLPKATPTAPAPHPRPPQRRRRKVVADAPASTAVIGTRTRHPRRHRPPSPTVRKPAARRREPSPETVPEYAPPPAPEPAPEPVYEPPPSPPTTPDDGSQEFAPH